MAYIPNYDLLALRGADRRRRTACRGRAAEETVMLILNDEAYSTNSRNNELCEALLATVEVQKAALEEPDR